MELQGAKQSFDFILLAGLAISVFISDRHRGIAKWIRENHPQTSHQITKKLLKAGKKKGYEKIIYWVKGIRRHLYWCATSTKQGFEQLILAKWKSFIMHVANRHTNHPDQLFQNCAHDELQRRKWIKIGNNLDHRIKIHIEGPLTSEALKFLSSRMSHYACWPPFS